MSSKYVSAFFDGIDAEHFPIYLLLIFVMGFQGITFIYMASEHGYDPAHVNPAMNALGALMLFVAVMPLLGGAANVIAVWYGGDADV